MFREFSLLMSFNDSAVLLLLASGAPESDGCFGLVAAVSLSPAYFYIDDVGFALLLFGLLNYSIQSLSSSEEFSLTESSYRSTIGFAFGSSRTFGGDAGFDTSSGFLVYTSALIYSFSFSACFYSKSFCSYFLS